MGARIFAEQYNYVSITLTKEYFVANNGLTDMNNVIRYMIRIIDFFSGQMRK